MQDGLTMFLVKGCFMMVKKIIVLMGMLLAVAGFMSAGTMPYQVNQVEAASVCVYSGKGVNVYADSTSKWDSGNACGINVSFKYENCGIVNYTFKRGSSGWRYSISSNAPDYASQRVIVNAVLKYIRTGKTTIEYDPS